jgi:hypothetical protein
MKVCTICGDEIATRDGENCCRKCDEDISDMNKPTIGDKQKARREKDAVMRSFGLVKVRGALGGTYWE